MLKQLVAYLMDKRSDIVRSANILEENWSPTYGLGEPTCREIEYVDFNGLINAIDDFAREFNK